MGVLNELGMVGMSRSAYFYAGSQVRGNTRKKACVV